MDWQQILSLACVAVAAFFLVGKKYRKGRRSSAASCARNCQCSSDHGRVTTNLVEKKAEVQ